MVPVLVQPAGYEQNWHPALDKQREAGLVNNEPHDQTKDPRNEDDKNDNSSNDDSNTSAKETFLGLPCFHPLDFGAHSPCPILTIWFNRLGPPLKPSDRVRCPGLNKGLACPATAASGSKQDGN